MATDEKHPVRNGIIIAVVSAAIIWAATFIPGVAHYLAHVAVEIGKLLAADVTHPRWLLLVICVFALIGMCRVSGPAFSIAPPPPQPTVADYSTDRFEGVVWRWHYGPDMRLRSVRCFCPECDTELLFVEDSYPAHVSLLCEHCGRTRHEANASQSYVINKVVRQIERKIRTGEWKNAIGPARTMRAGQI